MSLDNWVMFCYSMQKCAWPKQTPHSMFPITSLNSQRQTYPLAPHPLEDSYIVPANIKLKSTKVPSAVDMNTVCSLDSVR